MKDWRYHVSKPIFGTESLVYHDRSLTHHVDTQKEHNWRLEQQQNRPLEAQHEGLSQAKSLFICVISTAQIRSSRFLREFLGLPTNEDIRICLFIQNLNTS